MNIGAVECVVIGAWPPTGCGGVRNELLADEPTAHLDEESSRTVCESIANHARDRTTVLIVHEPLLTELADEIYVMQDGRLARSGSGRGTAPAWLGGEAIGATA